MKTLCCFLACLAFDHHKIHIVLNSGIPRVLGSLPAHSRRLFVTVSAFAYAFTVIKCERGIPRVMPPGLPVTLCYLSHFCILSVQPCCLGASATRPGFGCCVTLVPPLRTLVDGCCPWTLVYGCCPWSPGLRPLNPGSESLKGRSL